KLVAGLAAADLHLRRVHALRKSRDLVMAHGVALNDEGRTAGRRCRYARVREELAFVVLDEAEIGLPGIGVRRAPARQELFEEVATIRERGDSTDETCPKHEPGQLACTR